MLITRMIRADQRTGELLRQLPARMVIPVICETLHVSRLWRSLSLITGMALALIRWQKYPLPLQPNFAIPV
ncbi:Uncharacterised protein [Enterobacter cloacae]|nr:Uncharacterised protein [Enterobacter cloacae]